MSLREPRLINVYGPLMQHCDATIAGNVFGLRALRDAIDRALETGGDGVSAYTSGDGEGYAVEVLRMDDDADHYGFSPQLSPPYTAEFAYSGIIGIDPHETEQSGLARKAIQAAVLAEDREDDDATLRAERLDAAVRQADDLFDDFQTSDPTSRAEPKR